jgi:CRP-like cAMP-binding protein
MTVVDADRLRKLDLFADLDSYDLSQVARWVREVTAQRGDTLFEQGAIPYEMFVIEEGQVEVERDGETLATLGAGETVGEMGLMMQERRMASVRAATPVVALAIPADDLAELQAEMPEVWAAIRTTMEARRRSNLFSED